jgi:hypothetical protein
VEVEGLRDTPAGFEPAIFPVQSRPPSANVVRLPSTRTPYPRWAIEIPLNSKPSIAISHRWLCGTQCLMRKSGINYSDK